MAMSALASAVERVCDVLTASGFAEDARQMKDLLTEAGQGGAAGQAALARIRGRASIKDLGDLNVSGIPDNEWLELLSTVRSLSAASRT
jgi:hypothetical protein